MLSPGGDKNAPNDLQLSARFARPVAHSLPLRSAALKRAMAAEASDSAAAAAPAEAAPGTSSDPSSPPFVDMTGVYELDKAASDPISLFLKEVGVPWVGRKVSRGECVTLPVTGSLRTSRRAFGSHRQQTA